MVITMSQPQKRILVLFQTMKLAILETVLYLILLYSVATEPS